MADAKFIDRCRVRGICQTTGCQETYEKQFRAAVNAPFCLQCMGKKLPQLFVDAHPDILPHIISCEKLITTLTCGTSVQVIIRCDKNCSRCQKQHEYTTTIAQLHRRNKVTTCPFCKGRESCPCQGKDEFKCYECGIIKLLKDRCTGHSNHCIQCKRKTFEKNTKSFMNRLFRVANDLMKKKERKKGDLTKKYLIHLYENEQKGRCYISNVPMLCKSHNDWKTSIERIDNEKGYSDDNIKLIICELQSSHLRQWTRERWDELCSTTLGALENIPERRNLQKNTLRSILSRCMSGSITHAKERGDINNITFEDLLEQYKNQNGRCYYSMAPLAFTGFYQMSIDRVDVRQGYKKDNIVLVITPLNVGDWSRNKKDDDDRVGSSGWNKDKLLYAVRQNPRNISSRTSYLQDIYDNSTPVCKVL